MAAKLNSAPVAPRASTARGAPSPAAAIATLAWAHFLNDGAANYLPGVLPAILVGLGLPLAYAGAIMALLFLGQALQPAAGVLADRGDGRAYIVGGLAASTLAAACIGWASGPATLAAALVVVGVGNAAFHPSSLAAVRLAASGSGERPMSVFSIGGELGRGLWPLVASLVVAAIGLRALWLLSLPAAVTLPWLWRRAPRARPRARALSAWTGLKRAGRPLLLLVSYSSLRSVLIVAVSAFVPLLWRERGGHLVGGAGLITTMLLVGIIGNFGGAHFARRVGRRRMVALATLAACAWLAAFLFASGVWLWITMAGFGVAFFASLPLTIIMGQDLLPDHHSLGAALALGFSNAIGAVIVALLGLEAARWGAGGVLWAAEACGAAAVLLALALPNAPTLVAPAVS